MELPITTGTIIYAITYLLLYRLSVILLGAFSIYLGYRLFTQVLPSEKILNNNVELGVKVGITEFSLKKAAPGTFFAVFGAIIVITVLAGNQPEFITAIGKPTGEIPSNGNDVVIMRSDLTPEALKKQHEKILNHCDLILVSVKDLVDKQPDNGEYQDMLAGLYFINDEFDKALEAQKKAVRLLPDDEKLQRRLKAYQAALEK
jgi:hypothetical protein